MNQLQVSKTAWYSVALAVLTTIHHVYGAILYQTPWRLHILMMSIPVMILTLILRRHLVRKDTGNKCLMFLAFYFITLVPSLGLIGVYEGIYNHILKNIMYFAGAEDGLLQTLFPAPTYEMPNDLLFEFTGVGQGIIAIILIKFMYALTISLFKMKQPA